MRLPPSEIRKWTIYKITNPIGQVYIGKTHNWRNRLRQHKKLAHKNNSLITQSLLRFGPDNHHFEIIDCFESDRHYADGKEMFWIRTYMSNINKWPEVNGLNAYAGGQGNIGGTISDERKEKARIFHTGNKYALGRKETEEQKAKRIKALTGLKRNEEQRLKNREMNLRLRGIPIAQIDQNGNYIKQFDSISLASEALNVSDIMIRDVLKGKRKSTKGLYFKYKDNV